MRRGTGDQQPLLEYATDKLAPEYRAIMDVFLDAASSYELPLRSEQVATALRAADPPLDLDRQTLERRLEWLAGKGNLDQDQDNSYATDLETYERRERVYNLSHAGEYAHDALVGLEDRLRRQVGLQRVALARVLELLTSLVALLKAAEPDGPAVYHVIEELHHSFKSLTGNASAFVHQVNRLLNAIIIDVAEYQVFKVDTILYVTQFGDDLATVAADIRRAFAQLDDIGPERLARWLQAGGDSSGEREVAVASGQDSWAEVAHRRASGVREWFESSTGATSGVDKLRKVLGRAVRGIGQALDRIDIASRVPSAWTDDVLDLARAFHDAANDADAHRLWHLIAGLGSARHFTEDGAGELYAPRQSWQERPAPPVSVRPRSVNTAEHSGRAKNVPDHRASKQLLAIKAFNDKRRRDAAEATLVGLGRVHLSAIEQRLEFGCLLLLVNLIQRAHHRKADGTGVRRARSGDGRLRITLGPARPSAAAVLRTAGGQLTMPDYEIEITWTRGAVTTGPEDSPAQEKDDQTW
jgi:uncharacterized protein (TIGR02677 family)